MAARRSVNVIAGLTLAAGIWLFAAPHQLGGPVSVVSTFGTSMQPTYRASDLVVVTRASDYAVGDVVAYHSDEVGAVVLHRIVDEDARGYITQGDNNDWLDPDRPTDKELLGVARLRIPRAGAVLDLPPPVRGAAVAAAGTAAILAGRRRRRRRVRRPHPDAQGVQMPPASRRRRSRRTRTDHQPGEVTVEGSMAARQQVRAFWPGWPLQTALAAAIVAVIALVLIVLAFGRPAVSAGEMSYTHRGQFTYTADAPTGLVYPDGTVETGDPVFLRLVDQVDVAFDYQPPTNGLTTTGQLWLEITDNSGWSTRTPLGEAQTAVDGLKATLQPAQLRRTIQQIGEETGVPAGAATIAVVASVAVEGHLHGQPIADDFVAQLHFQLDEHRLTPRIENGTDADAFVVTEDHSHTVPDAEAARLELAGRGIPVASARLLGPVLLIGALAAFATATSAARRRGSLDEPSRIDAQHGDRLVEVSDIGLPAGYGIVDVQQMDALARLAEQTERPILHHRLHEAHTYLVEGDATIYRYRTGEPSRTD